MRIQLVHKETLNFDVKDRDRDRFTRYITNVAWMQANTSKYKVLSFLQNCSKVWCLLT